MGPKSKEAPKTVEPAVGAKFAYVLVGQRSSPLKIMINLNCIVQILLDSIKSQLIRKIDEKIALMKNATLVQEVATATGQPNSNGGAEVPTSEQNEEIIQKLLEFQKTIQNDNGELDLLDTTGKIALGCNQKLNAIAMDGVLTQGTQYLLGVVSVEDPTKIEALLIEDVVERPPSGKKK